MQLFTGPESELYLLLRVDSLPHDAGFTHFRTQISNSYGAAVGARYSQDVYATATVKSVQLPKRGSGFASGKPCGLSPSSKSAM